MPSFQTRPPTSSFFPQLFIAEHDVAWCGKTLWSFGVSYPSCVPSQLRVHAQSTYWWGGMRSRKGLDSVQSLLGNNNNIPVLSTLISAQIHSPTQATLAKPLKEKGSGAEAHAEGPFLKWQNRSGKTAKVPGERRHHHPHSLTPLAGKRELLKSSSSDSVWARMSVTAAKPPRKSSPQRAWGNRAGKQGQPGYGSTVARKFGQAGCVGRAQSLSWQPN